MSLHINGKLTLGNDIDWLVTPVNISVENREKGIPPI
jgi:hypothetical protein